MSTANVGFGKDLYQSICMCQCPKLIYLCKIIVPLIYLPQHELPAIVFNKTTFSSLRQNDTLLLKPHPQTINFM